MRKLFALAIATSMTTSAACGGPDISSEPFDERTSSAATAAPQSAWDSLVAAWTEIGNDAKLLAAPFSAFSTVLGGANAALTLLQLVGLIDKPVNEVGLLSQKLDQVATGLTWQISATARANDYAAIVSTIDTISTFNALNKPYDFFSPGYQDSLVSVTNGEQPSSFRRVFVESATDGLPASPLFGFAESSIWKAIIPDRPDIVNGQVYDWRIALPVLLKMVSLRIIVIATVDPNFQTDHAFDVELRQHRDALLIQYNAMKTGVRCGSSNYISSTGAHLPTKMGCRLTCADIHTGLNAIARFPHKGEQRWPPDPRHPNNAVDTLCENIRGTAAYVDTLNDLEWQVKSKMPIYETRWMVDLLSRYVIGGWDVTDLYGHMEPEDASPRLCLNLPGGNPAPGVRLDLQPCDGSEKQSWIYYRPTGQVSNPFTDTCLDVQNGSARPGMPVWSWPCTPHHGTPPQVDNKAQEWTYDPVQKRLQNALGGVLEASALTQGSLLNAKPPRGVLFKPGMAAPTQRWHADVPSDPFP